MKSRRTRASRNLYGQSFKNNAELISDNVKRMAELFGVEPELLLSNLLVFQIHAPACGNTFSLSLTGDLSYEKDRNQKQSTTCIRETTRIHKSILEKAKKAQKKILGKK